MAELPGDGGGGLGYQRPDLASLARTLGVGCLHGTGVLDEVRFE